MNIELEFTDKEIREYLKKNGYSITKVSYKETTMETDEFYGGTYTREVELALKPDEKVKKKYFMINPFTKSGPMFPQEYDDVFKKLIKTKYKNFFLNL